ncbi:MAG: NAD(P)H-binding protein [Saprospiraceae bacterium]|nr:NAD(P)H-binding protein [Saprospiraceae bacterium]
MKEQILVLGGTGKTGRKIVEQLQTQGYPVRIGSRRAAIPFDWDAPENWSEVLQGMDKMYVTYQPDLAVPGALEAIEQLVRVAKQQGIKKLVLLSGKGEREAELSEQVVIHSGLDYTIVRASWFSQNFSESFLLEPIMAGFVALPQANVKIPFVDTNDIAEVAVQALTNDLHNGKIYHLTGPEAITFPQAIAEIATQTNRHIDFQPVSLDEYSAALKAAPLPEGYAWLIDYLFREVIGQASVSDISTDVEQVLGRKPTSFQEYVSTTKETGVWN